MEISWGDGVYLVTGGCSGLGLLAAESFLAMGGPAGSSTAVEVVMVDASRWRRPCIASPRGGAAPKVPIGMYE